MCDFNECTVELKILHCLFSKYIFILKMFVNCQNFLHVVKLFVPCSSLSGYLLLNYLSNCMLFVKFVKLYVQCQIMLTNYLSVVKRPIFCQITSLLSDYISSVNVLPIYLSIDVCLSIYVCCQIICPLSYYLSDYVHCQTVIKLTVHRQTVHYQIVYMLLVYLFFVKSFVHSHIIPLLSS